jgi:NAD(P)-dependent dehydrogenase (short-subunit alcohol dehydrogenase family)
MGDIALCQRRRPDSLSPGSNVRNLGLEDQVVLITGASRGLGYAAAATVEEYRRTVAWLASPAAPFIHGHTLFPEGGIIRAAL